ncbi:PAS domain S-box protein [Mongoliitalea daihaiensis]|uniref:PAS domain S-box protein n=1 Tax=Mongoliitalea daihaiensis TaxID=2782006 RepID=UPI001F345922|nr:PAS domain S-box protein [Mongoliitalea daihaiensis]UJP64344.1 PAS domain S-box protein [Mongoliitalea daihaiensis]
MNYDPNYSSLFYFNPLPSWVYDLETYQILDVNEAAILHYGYSKVAFLDLKLSQLQLIEEIPQMIAAHATIDSSDGNIFFGVFTHLKKNGERIRMEINGHKLDFLGRASMLVVCQDVTLKEKQFKVVQASKVDLQISEANFRTIFEIATLGIAQVDPFDGKILLINSYFEQITGYSREELRYMNFLELTHEDDRANDSEVFNRAKGGEAAYCHEKRFVRKDGSIIWVRAHVACIRDEYGKVSKTVTICENISTQKQEEQRLKLLESVITNTKDSILITEAQPFNEPGPKILYVNDAFTQMTGYTREEVIGKTPRILQGPNSNKEELKRLGKAIRNWESCEITVINYKKNGEEFWINFAVTPVADQNGWYTHWIAIERDVTEQKQKEIANDLLAQISLNFSYQNDLKTSLEEFCASIERLSDFDLVELWIPNIENTQINLITTNSHKPKFRDFYKIDEQVISLDVEKSLPVSVWRKKTIVVKEIVDGDLAYVGKDVAKNSNKTSALGIPLLFNGAVEGVLIITSHRDLQDLKQYLDLFQNIGPFIGTEIKRKRLENDLSYLYKSIPDILCLVDFEGRFLKINTAGIALLGYSEQEILCRSFDDLVHPEDKRSTILELKKLKDGGGSIHFENRYINQSGEVIWLSWTCNSSMEEGMFYATAKNITLEKKLVELNTISSQLAKIGSWEFDLVRGELFCSDMVYTIYETSPTDIMLDIASVITMYREDFRDEASRLLTNCIRTGESFDFEGILVTHKKNERWVRTIGSAEFIEKKCHRIYGSFQDIHTSKSLELQIREILDSISDAFYAMDKNWNFTYFNKEAENLLGKKAEDVLGKSVWTLFPAAEHTLIHEIYVNVAESGRAASFEYWYPGDGKWYEINAYPSQGGVSAYFRDITLRKQVDLQLVKANERFQKVTEATNDTIWDWDIIKGEYYRSNAIEKIFGIGTSKLLNEKDFWKDKFHPDDLEELKESLDKSLKDPDCKRWEKEYRIFNSGGEIIYVIDRGVIVRDENNQPIRMVGAMTDISEQKRFEHRLLELNESLKKYARVLELTNQELEQFAFVTSHDLQEPLRMIVGFMELLKKKYGNQLDEKANQYIEFAYDGAKKMKGIIMDLLEYSTAGNFTGTTELVNLNEVLKDYQLLRRKIITNKSAELIISHLPSVQAFKVPLVQTFHSLLDNAIKYSRPGVSPKIEVKVEDMESFLKVTISDNGIGIDQEYFDKIFIIFQRIPTKDHHKGTGIGLAVAKRHVESWGGEIGVTSVLGQGSDFYFTIPKRTNYVVS